MKDIVIIFLKNFKSDLNVGFGDIHENSHEVLMRKFILGNRNMNVLMGKFILGNRNINVLMGKFILGNRNINVLMGKMGECKPPSVKMHNTGDYKFSNIKMQFSCY